jgi:hypothetical protein
VVRVNDEVVVSKHCASLCPSYEMLRRYMATRLMEYIMTRYTSSLMMDRCFRKTPGTPTNTW